MLCAELAQTTHTQKLMEETQNHGTTKEERDEIRLQLADLTKVRDFTKKQLEVTEKAMVDLEAETKHLQEENEQLQKRMQALEDQFKSLSEKL